MPQTHTVCRAFNDARNVRHHERHAISDVDDTQIRVERRKMVVCDLRVRVGRDGKKRRFADVREADQTHIREQFELQNNLVLLAGKTGLCKARHLPGRGRKVLVAPAAAAALAEDIVLRIGHVLDDLVRLAVAHDRTARDLDDEVFSALSLAAAALAVHAVGRDIFALIAEVHEGGQIIVDPQNDRAAVSAVAAVGPSRRHVFFPMEGNRAIAARARLHINFCFINKH